MALMLPFTGNDNDLTMWHCMLSSHLSLYPNTLLMMAHLITILVSSWDRFNKVQNSVYNSSVKIVLLKVLWQFYGRLKKKKRTFLSFRLVFFHEIV